MMELLIVLLAVDIIMGAFCGSMEYSMNDDLFIGLILRINIFGRIILSPVLVPYLLGYLLGILLCKIFVTLFVKR